MLAPPRRHQIFAGDDDCVLGDRQRLFGVVSINRESVREIMAV
jgi:hypothetical protein